MFLFDKNVEIFCILNNVNTKTGTFEIEYEDGFLIGTLNQQKLKKEGFWRIFNRLYEKIGDI